MLKKTLSIFICIIFSLNMTALAAIPSSNKKDLKTLGIRYGKNHIITKGSKDVLVAVIDSGINNDYKDYNRNKNGYNLLNDCSRSNDTSLSTSTTSHGTSVAAIIGGKGKITSGIAPNVQILDITWCWQLEKAINYASEMKCDIINISQKIFDAQVTPELTKAIQNFKGLIVVAAGNDGKDINKVNYNQLTYQNFPNVITVGALGNANKGIMGYSTFNKSKIDICIKGEYAGVKYVGNKWKPTRFTGTSCAAPIVTGMAALYKTKNKKATGATMKKALIKATTKKGYTNYTKKFKYGRVDVKKLLRPKK